VGCVSSFGAIEAGDACDHAAVERGWRTAKLTEIPSSAEVPLPRGDPPFEQELRGAAAARPRGGRALEPPAWSRDAQ
jgi:hypothetical protein